MRIMKLDKKSLKRNIDQIDFYDTVRKTPLQKQQQLSERFKNNIYLKREDLQPVYSFKLRGAYNKLTKLTEKQRMNGVIAASAGNHAQGVALGAKKLKCQATIVMPVTTPKIKIEAVKQYGAEVILHGESYSDAYVFAKNLSDKNKITFVHPYDDIDVIAGQGTIAKEIVENFKPDIDAVFCCVGGGGLLAGVASYFKAINPKIKIIGVEAKGAEAMTQSLQKNKIVTLKQVALFADGAAVKQVGENTFKLCKENVDEMIVVDNDSICAAIKDVFEDSRTILEPAGALAVAGIKAYIDKYNVENQNLIGIASGANINFDRLRFVAERAEIGEQREALLAVTIPEKPGAFKRFCNLLGMRNITEFNYRYADHANAQIFVGITIDSAAEIKKIIKDLKQNNLEAIDLSNNEVAKLHLRHMVGGHAPQAKNELVYRFEFPEKPGALMNFLEHMGQNWNISLFHYRNHGADTGRVMVGIQVPAKDKKVFESFLKNLGYPYWDETKNSGYKLFLGKS